MGLYLFPCMTFLCYQSHLGGYILGFRVDPDDRLEAMGKETIAYLKMFATNPIFGVDYTIESEQPKEPLVSATNITEDAEIVDDDQDTHALAAYFVDGNGENDVQASDALDSSSGVNIHYEAKLGLAIEAVAGDLSLESLWRVA